MIETFNDRERVPEPSETRFELEGKQFVFGTYNVGKTKDLPNPGLMPTGAWQQVMQTWSGQPTPPWVSEQWRQYERIPYTFLLPGSMEHKHGDFTTDIGMDEFKDADLRLTDQEFSPQD